MQRRGPAHDLWQAARRFEVVLGEQHFAELIRVLTYPQVSPPSPFRSGSITARWWPASGHHVLIPRTGICWIC